MLEEMEDPYSIIECATLASLDDLPVAFAELSSAMLAEPDSRQEKALEFASLLHHTGSLAVPKGWLGLLDICSLLGERLAVFATEAELLSSPVLSACCDWALNKIQSLKGLISGQM